MLVTGRWGVVHWKVGVVYWKVGSWAPEDGEESVLRSSAAESVGPCLPQKNHFRLENPGKKEKAKAPMLPETRMSYLGIRQQIPGPD